MKFLLVASKPDKLRDILGFTKAAVRQGHNVTIFFNEDSVTLLKKGSPVEMLYAELLACRASARDLDIPREGMISNARMSSLTELVELLEQSDRVVFLN